MCASYSQLSKATLKLHEMFVPYIYRELIMPSSTGSSMCHCYLQFAIWKCLWHNPKPQPKVVLQLHAILPALWEKRILMHQQIKGFHSAQAYVCTLNIYTYIYIFFIHSCYTNNLTVTCMCVFDKTEAWRAICEPIQHVGAANETCIWTGFRVW